VLFKIPLMVLLRFPEPCSGHHLGYNVPVKALFLPELFYFPFGEPFLLFAQVKNSRAILFPDIRPLLVEGCWVVAFKKYVE